MFAIGHDPVPGGKDNSLVIRMAHPAFGVHLGVTCHLTPGQGCLLGFLANQLAVFGLREPVGVSADQDWLCIRRWLTVDQKAIGYWFSEP